MDVCLAILLSAILLKGVAKRVLSKQEKEKARKDLGVRAWYSCYHFSRATVWVVVYSCHTYILDLKRLPRIVGRRSDITASEQKHLDNQILLVVGYPDVVTEKRNYRLMECFGNSFCIVALVSSVLVLGKGVRIQP